MSNPKDYFVISKEFEQILPRIGINSAASVFENPAIKVWRSIPERENAVLDATLPDGKEMRFHIKRIRADGKPTMEEEMEGIFLLQRAKIPTVEPAAWGRLPDGRSFVVTPDLEGYVDAEKLVQGGMAFDKVLAPTAQLTARLHEAKLHHRDLYLCHFFVKATGSNVDVKLIDAARVRPLPGWFASRWIVKDLAQFWYSTTHLKVTDGQRNRWLDEYAKHRTGATIDSLRASILTKVQTIARHDARLQQRQPTRNVSIPK